MNAFLVDTYRILSLTDWTEYLALTGQATKSYNLIISAGIVDLSEGSTVHTLLWEMFPEGTVTGDRFRLIENSIVKPPDAEVEEGG